MLRLRTLGGVGLLDGERPLEGAVTQRRRLAVLAVLAVAGRSGTSRDRLLALLWPASDEERARHSLRQWLFLLRRDLHVEDLVLGTTELRLNPERIGSDVEDFEGAVAAGDHERAVALYQGPFLDDFHLPDTVEFAHWVDGQRARLAALFARALERAAEERMAAGSPAGAVDAWRRLAAQDPCDSRIALQLMEALDRAGDRAGAIAHARIHERLVREEMEADPDPAVHALAERLRTAPPAAAPSVASDATPAPTTVDTIMESTAEPTADRTPPSMASASVPGTTASPSTPPPGEPVANATVPVPSGSARRTVRPRLRALATGATLGVVALVLVAGRELIPAEIRANTLTLLTRAPATIEARRVVVAPLENHTGDPALDALGEMAADWIAQALMRTGDFEVVDPRTSLVNRRVVERIPSLLRSSDRAVALAEESGARTVITGRYYRDADSLRVHVRIMDVPSGTISRLTDPVSGTAAASGRLVETLGQRVAALAVSARDTSAAGLGISVTSPPSLEAYREASRAWDAYFRADLPRFFAHAQRAIAIDSSYMAPVAMQAHVRSEMRDWPRVDSLARRLDAARARLSPLELAALELTEAQLRGDLEGQYRAAAAVALAAPASPEMRTYLAHMAVRANRPRAALLALEAVDPQRGAMLVIPWYWNWKTAALHALGDHATELAEARRGLRQFPGHPLVVLNTGRALAATGDVAALRRLARELPSSSSDERKRRHKLLLDWSRELRAHGHDDEAQQLLAVLLAEQAPPAAADTADWQTRAGALALAGRWADVERVARRALELAPDDLGAVGRIGVAAAASGDRATAERVSERLARLEAPYLFGRHTLWRARIAAAVGRPDDAVALLHVAFAQGHPRFFDPAGGAFEEPEYHIDPALRPVARHAGFQRLLAARD